MGEEEKKPAAAEEKQVKEKKPEEATGKKKPEAAAQKKEGEEEKKPAAEVKKEEKKTEETKDEKKTEESSPPSPPPPQEIVLKVYMHCEGCARKVRRSLKGFEGVDDVLTDCKAHRVVVKGEKANPLKVAERVQRKSHRHVELLSPIPKPPSEEEKKVAEEKEKPKPEEKKDEPPPVITVWLRVYMHCEACAQVIKKRILRMKGVESVEPDLKGSEVTVKGVFDPPNLVEYVYKRTGKHAVVVKQEPEKKEETKADANKEGKKGEEGGGDNEKKADGGAGEEEKKEAAAAGGGDANSEEAEAETIEETKVVELKRYEYDYYHPRYGMEFYSYAAYPPQIFSDENPNACSVM